MGILIEEITFDPRQVETPYYIVDEGLLRKNLQVLQQVKERSGCKILLAQKAFSMFRLYPLISQYLDGTTASGLYEAKLGAEEFGKETHIFSPAYTERDFEEICLLCDHIVFNSFSQWKKFGEHARKAGKQCGLRINPEYSTQDHGIYDPCGAYSRLGITREQFEGETFEGIDGLHFHTLCEQNAMDLLRTLEVVEDVFGPYLKQMKWINFGGGHHITRADYDIDALVSAIVRIRETYDIDVYLEPGEAIALHTGYLVSSVIDLVKNGMEIAILDTSAACHMPDVLEMPYRPHVIGSGNPKEKKHTYRFGGPTCLAGDIIGDYSFDHLLKVGDYVVFCDMAHYSMVKNNTFNGMKLPTICLLQENGEIEIVKQFGYDIFKSRLS